MMVFSAFVVPTPGMGVYDNSARAANQPRSGDMLIARAIVNNRPVE